MSGRHFGYGPYEIRDIGEHIELLIENNDDTTLNSWGEPKGHGYPAEIIDKFREAVQALRVAYVYAQRVDWLLSGDDGEDSFLRRLGEELGSINNKKED